MTENATIETHHGVLLNILNQGVFITGKAGIGKSSLALECLYHGHQLIADDIAEFVLKPDHTVIGQCPALLSDLLHTKELGLIPVTALFGPDAWQKKSQLDIVIHLDNDLAIVTDDLRPTLSNTLICGQSIPSLSLSTQNPASLLNRIQTWLKVQTTMQDNNREFELKHQNMMT